MTPAYTARELLDTARDGLLAIGYRNELVQPNYTFADPLAPSPPVRSIDLAAFAQAPPSYRSACFGVVVLPQNGYDGAEAIRQYQALGAPQILGLHPKMAQVQRWKVVAEGVPQLIERIDPAHLYNAILEHREEWSPEQILRAKSIGFRAGAVQLDFFDFGLVPTIESIVQDKLDTLLQQVIADCKKVYFAKHHQEPDYRALFRLVFRLIAAKLLSDRHHPGRDWDNPDPARVIQAVEAFYFLGTPLEEVLPDADVQQTAWDKIRTAFHFANVSVETLAYVYENTLVSTETRRMYDVHATPPEVAEYIVRALPFESLPPDERHVFEPFAGHAPFLIAALGRLRTLLPPDMNQDERHRYFVEMLSGLEIDVFAAEVARHSLMFADYPNPDGWCIINADAFTSPDFTSCLLQAQIVLCNPPYGDFDQKARKATDAIRSPNKAVEALRRVLEHPPKMLGFVLPRVFVNGQMYREARKKLASLYSEIEIVGLPETAFQHSDIPTTLLIAHGERVNGSRLRTSEVEREDYQQFVRANRPTWQTEAPPSYVAEATNPTLWYSPVQCILDELAYLPSLGEIADVHRGIEYNILFKHNEDRLVSNSPKRGFVPGLVNTKQGFEPYVAHAHQYLNSAKELMLYEAYLRPWDQPKVIANASRISKDRWVIAGAVDEQGLVCYQRFHGIWPKNGIPVEVLAAVVNGPIANAFVSIHRTPRDNQVRIVRQIPVPMFTAAQTHSIVALVRDYRRLREQWLQSRCGDHPFEVQCREIVWEIDAEVLAAYDLSPRLERRLLDYFEGFQRPGPIQFDRYYPPGFRPSIPWRVFISEDFRASTASQTLARLPVIVDPAISAVVHELVE